MLLSCAVAATGSSSGTKARAASSRRRIGGLRLFRSVAATMPPGGAAPQGRARWILHFVPLLCPVFCDEPMSTSPEKLHPAIGKHYQAPPVAAEWPPHGAFRMQLEFDDMA